MKAVRAFLNRIRSHTNRRNCAWLLLMAAQMMALTSPTRAQTSAASAVNTASFALPGLPNGSLAQGGMFAVFGSTLGPGGLVQVSEFPLPVDLAGTSVTVTVRGTTVQCIMVFTTSGQIAAVLPSDTPVGDASLVVTYNGQSSDPIAVKIVPHSFGIFGINSAGTGPGVLTNALDPSSVNTVLNSAQPGSQWDVWGTGLGAAPGISAEEEAARPAPGDLPYAVKVLVGDQEAQVVYRGRSGCCVGLDQIRFIVPQGVTGCYVPLRVEVEGVVSNFVSMAISENGGPCSDPDSGLNDNVLSQARSSGNLRIGQIAGLRMATRFTVSPGAFQTVDDFVLFTETIIADFQNYDIPQLERTQGFLQGNVRGTCSVYQFSGSDGAEALNPVSPLPLDPGTPVTLNGRVIPQVGPGAFFENLGFNFGGPSQAVAMSIPDEKGQFPLPSTPAYFKDNMSYTAMWPGGADVGAGSTRFNVGTPLVITNPPKEIVRGSPHRVDWEGGSGELVSLFGVSSFGFDGEGNGSGAAFFCGAERAAGTFTIPGDITGALPQSGIEAGVPQGSLSVGSESLEECSANGLDLCYGSFSDRDNRFGVMYR